MKKVVFGLSVVLAAVVGYAVYLQTEVSRLAKLVAEPLDAESSRVESSEPAVSEEVTAQENEGSKPSDGVQTATRLQPPESQQQNSGEEQNRVDRRQQRMDRMAALFEDPQMRADMVERQMGRIDDRFAQFFKTLNLSSEEMDTLRTLMAERNVLNWESRMRRFGAEDEVERDLIAAERELHREVLADEIEGLLGKEDTVALKQYSDSLPYRSDVEALAKSLSFTETPLSDSQSEALVSSMQAASKEFEYTKDLSEMRGPRREEVTRRDIETYFSERTERDALVLEIASDTLDDAQLAALAERQLAERERDRRQMEFMQQNPPVGRGGNRGPRQ